MKRQIRRYCRWAGAALVAGLLLRLWSIRHFTLIAGDSLVYGDIAKNWIEHGIYGFTETGPLPGSIEIRPTLIRLPGYPLFLAACFRIFGMAHYSAVLYVQTAADLLTCWLIAALARRFFGDRAGLAVLWLGALCPFTATYVAAPLTETLVLTTIALSFYSFARWQDGGCGSNRWLWLTAAALGASLLLRPEQILFAAVVLLAMLWAGVRSRGPLLKSALPVLAAGICVLLPLVPWTLRNLRTFHVFQPLAPRYANDPGELAPLGFSRWYRTWAIDFADTENVYWNYSGDPISLSDLPQRAFDAGSPQATLQVRQATAQLIADYNATTRASSSVIPAIDARFAALAAERIRTHPVRFYAGLPVARVLDMTLGPRTEMMQVPLHWWAWSRHRAQTAYVVGYAALNLAYIAIGIAGFCVWRRRGWSATEPGSECFRELALAMAAAIVVRAALLLTLDNSEPRYTLEFFPALFVWAGALFRPAPPEHERGGR